MAALYPIRFDSLRRRSPQDSIPPQLNAILQELGTRKRI
jgi:hypothetical protein